MGSGYQHRVAVLVLIVGAAVASAGSVAADEPGDSGLRLPVTFDAAATLVRDLGVAPARAGSVTLTVDAADFRRRVERPRFYAAHLLPRFERQFADAMAVEAAPLVGHGLADHAVYRWMADDAAARAERAGRKAVRDSLLETAAISRILEWAESRGDDPGSSGPGRAARRGGIDVGIAHGLPRVSLSRSLAVGDFRAGVSARGTADVGFTHARFRRLQFNAGWDPADDEVAIGCRIGF